MIRNMEIWREALHRRYTRCCGSAPVSREPWETGGLALVGTQFREHIQLRDQGRPVTAGPREGGKACEAWASSAGKASFSSLNGS